MNSTADETPAAQGAQVEATDRLIDDSVARLFAEQVDNGTRMRAESGEFDSALWQRVRDSGFALLLASPAAGGFGQSWTAALPVLRGIGYWQVPLPLAETMVARLLASLVGFDVADAPLTLLEQGRGNSLQISGSGGGATLSGVAHAVPWARHAHAALASLQDGRFALLELQGQSGVTVQPHTNHAGLPADTLVLKHARLRAVATHPLNLREPVWTLGAVARSAMLVGALESALEQAVGYAAQRVQFHQVTMPDKGQACGISELDPLQREIFEALKIEIPMRHRLQTAV